MPRANPFLATVVELSPNDFALLSSAVAERRCRECGTRFNSLTGTLLERGKSDMPTWVDFVRLMRLDVPIDAIAEVCRVSHQTAWGWRRRPFEAVDDYRDRLALRDRVWLDEAYLIDTDLTHGHGEAVKGGLSKQKVCIVVAIDVHKSPVARVCGHGEPSSKRTRDALEKNVTEGPTLVGEKERAHNALARAVKGTHEAYKADARMR